jgi:peptide/nickel transport system permease protein
MRLLRDPAAAISLIFIVAIILAAAFAPWIVSGDPYETDLRATLQPPGGEYLLGTDAQGRDLVVRLIYGFRVTLTMALTAIFIGGGLGTLLGFFAAFYRRLDAPIMRVMDVLLSFPAILFGLAIAAVAGPGVPAVVIAMSIGTIPLVARVVRSSALVESERDYMEAARAVGVSDKRLIFVHLAPNCLSPLFVFLTLRLGQVILLGSALSFIGLGAQPPTAELGAMAAAGRQFLFFAPHIAVVPSLAIFAIVLAFNVLGDALRDVLDPKLGV